ncbi:MAG: hemerythrin domain-containing protein [bacterium]
MYKIGKYRSTDSMSALICDNYALLQVLGRFNIPLGVEDKSIGEVCAESNVDTATFLAVINLMLNKKNANYKVCLDGVMIDYLMLYIRNSHRYYLEMRLPKIRTKLIAALADDKLTELLVKYFDDYVIQIKEHLKYEENEVFPYIDRIQSNLDRGDYSIDLYTQQHDHIDEPLTEFKNVLIKYYKGDSTYEIMGVIHDLLSCADDLNIHNLVEDKLLVPLIQKIEEE